MSKGFDSDQDGHSLNFCWSCSGSKSADDIIINSLPA